MQRQFGRGLLVCNPPPTFTVWSTPLELGWSAQASELAALDNETRNV